MDIFLWCDCEVFQSKDLEQLYDEVMYQFPY